jgi:PIN domain nuclease of toxin-antitoxin system
VRLLLDTHAALWYFDDPFLLTEEARTAIESSESVAYLSAASVWEWALKRARERVTTPGDMVEGATLASFEPLPVTWVHVQTAAALPTIHGDSFDRMLVAQAIAENLVLVTRNRTIPRYGVATLAA